MGLASAVKGSRYIAQQITWSDEDGTVVDLTGATLTGKIVKSTGGTSRAIDGTLSLVTPASGIFSWAYGDNDVGTVGTFKVQFTAAFAGGLSDITLLEEWTVEPAL